MHTLQNFLKCDNGTNTARSRKYSCTKHLFKVRTYAWVAIVRITEGFPFFFFFKFNKHKKKSSHAQLPGTHNKLHFFKKKPVLVCSHRYRDTLIKHNQLLDVFNCTVDSRIVTSNHVDDGHRASKSVFFFFKCAQCR